MAILNLNIWSLTTKKIRPKTLAFSQSRFNIWPNIKGLSIFFRQSDFVKSGQTGFWGIVPTCRQLCVNVLKMFYRKASLCFYDMFKIN